MGERPLCSGGWGYGRKWGLGVSSVGGVAGNRSWALPKVKAGDPADSGLVVGRSSVGRGGAIGEGRGFIRSDWPG